MACGEPLLPLLARVGRSHRLRGVMLDLLSQEEREREVERVRGRERDKGEWEALPE